MLNKTKGAGKSSLFIERDIMKIIKINKDRIFPAEAKRFLGKEDGYYYAIEHGETGFGKWCVRMPLSSIDFPVPEIGKITHIDQYAWECDNGCVGNVLATTDMQTGNECVKCKTKTLFLNTFGIEFKLRFLNKKDPMGNDLYILHKGEDDGSFLVFWNLNSGYKGSANYSFSGDVKLLATAQESQEINGDNISTPCPIMYVFGDCKLYWSKTGKVYGNSREFTAEFKDNKWSIK